MKKAVFTLFLMAGLFNFTSCTEDSLAEATNIPGDYANEDANTDPDEEKPGGD